MKVIYVDDELPARMNFRLTAEPLDCVNSLLLFDGAQAVLDWARENTADVAFLDLELGGGVGGLELARMLQQVSPATSVVFITAYSQHALEAFGVGAIGYVLKPYTREDIRRELAKAARIRPPQSYRVRIQTMPTFRVEVDGAVLHLSGNKASELLALLVDRAGAGVSSGEAIACLWPDRPRDRNTGALMRMTAKRLMDSLREVGAAQIVGMSNREKWIVREQVDCDLYRILDGEPQAVRCYTGEYLREYSWAEDTNAHLARITGWYGRMDGQEDTHDRP